MNQNILKALLIAWVVVDHNDYSRSLFPGFLQGLSFHVVGFLALPFLRDPPRFSRAYLVSSFYRIYYPFLVVSTLLGLAVALASSAGVMEWVPRMLMVWYSANHEILKRATHMALLWFLPSMFSLVILLSLVERCAPPARTALQLAIAVSHLFIGVFAQDVKNFVPLNLLPALYVFPLALCIAVLHRTVFARMGRPAALALSAAVFVGVKYSQIRLGLSQEVGFAQVSDYRTPLALLVNDLEAVTGVLLLIQLARLPLGSLVESFGKFSLQVYLIHGFVGFGLYKLMVVSGLQWPVVLKFGVLLAMTLVISYFLSRVAMGQGWVRRFVFPRSHEEFMGAGARRTASPASL